MRHRRGRGLFCGGGPYGPPPRARKRNRDSVDAGSVVLFEGVGGVSGGYDAEDRVALGREVCPVATTLKIA